jgi:kumamolisin
MRSIETMAKHLLQGSERSVAEGSTLVGNCNPAERIEVHVVLRRHAQAQFDALLGKIEAGDPSVKPLSREAFAKEFGAAAEDMTKVKAFAAQSGLTVVREDPAARTVVLGGTIAQFQAAFNVELHHYQHHSIGQYRGRTGSISVPRDGRAGARQPAAGASAFPYPPADSCVKGAAAHLVHPVASRGALSVPARRW